MTRDDIIRIAQEAGFQRDMFGRGIWDNKDFNRFAALVTAAERKECAAICLNMAQNHLDLRSAALEVAAERILMRGET